MKRQSGFSLVEIITVVILLSILTTVALFSFSPYVRQVKTEDGASALFGLMRQARIQAITRRQYYAVVINTNTTEPTPVLLDSGPAGTSTVNVTAHSISLVDMGDVAATGDEIVKLSKKFPIDVQVNDPTVVGPLMDPAFPITAAEKGFTPPTLSGGLQVFYFDPAGRIVTKAGGAGLQVYGKFYFSSFDINRAQNPTLLRLVTVYGATGSLKFWRLVGGNWTASL